MGGGTIGDITMRGGTNERFFIRRQEGEWIDPLLDPERINDFPYTQIRYTFPRE